ncbi:MAG: cysteine--tRNA ligase [Thermoplasmata archaeon]
MPNKEFNGKLMVYNTISRQKEEFQPIHGNKVFMYVCGPTVYDHCHVGHARSYVAFDMIRRYLEHKGYTVVYVQNFTDVDDKIITRAKEMGEDPLVLSKKFIESYFEDMDKLNVRRANIHPKVSEHIPEIIEMVGTLIEKGSAYEINGSVYFSIDNAKDKVGKLSHQSVDDLMAGARVEIDESKRNPLDFALWKKAKPGEIFWESPWGKGRPGWHIECSTMSMQYLDATLDIHGGGMDLVFPHHESEILQSESYSGKEFAKYWIHNGFITVNKEKMSKSLGNFFTVREILEKYEPEVLRFFLLYTHYRSPIDFSDKHLDEAKQSYGRIINTIQNLKDIVNDTKLTEGKRDGTKDKTFDENLKKIRKRFYDFMDDDFNTREALAAVFELTTFANELISKRDCVTRQTVEKVLSLYSEFGEILGLFQQHRKIGKSEKASTIISELTEMVVGAREEYRKKEDWVNADKIRDDLQRLGIHIEDSKSKPKVRRTT